MIEAIFGSVVAGLIGAAIIRLVIHVRRSRASGLWALIGRRSLLPGDHAVEVLRAANASTVDLYRSVVLGVVAPNRPHSWDRVFSDADWRDLRNFKDPRGSIDAQLDTPLAAAILKKLASLEPGATSHVWITGDAEVGKSSVLLHVFFALLGQGDPSTPDGYARVPVPMLLRPGHLSAEQRERLRSVKTFGPIFAAWLANRDLELDAPTLESVGAGLERALSEGRVAVFLDGYTKFLDAGLDEPMRTLRAFPVLVGTAAAAPTERAPIVRSIANVPPRAERYRASFGKLFAEHQDWLLAGASTALEVDYVKRIEHAIEEASKASETVVLVDLMAGGASERWLRLLEAHHALRILGLDRDATRIDRLADEPSLRERYVAWQVALRGSSVDDPVGRSEGNLLRSDGLDIRGQLAALGRDPAVGADVVVGKKAIHEIRADLQPHLIRESAKALREGGHLILFADAPGQMGSPQLGQLIWIRTQLHDSLTAADPSADLIRNLMGLRFDRSEASVALFINLWVMLKDRANNNIPEVENRYFAGPEDITMWCEAAGLRPAPDGHTDGQYRVAPEKFNEDALREALDGLSENPNAGHEEVMAAFGDITRNRGPWFRLLLDFTWHHLYPDGSQSDLGASVDAQLRHDSWDPGDCRCENRPAIHELLQLINNSVGLTFNFPVHVLEFTKGDEARRHTAEVKEPGATTVGQAIA